MNKFILCTIWLLAAVACECTADAPVNPTPSPSPATPSPSPAPGTNLTPGSLNLNPVTHKLQERSTSDQNPPVSPPAKNPQGGVRSLTLAPQPASAKTETTSHGKAHSLSTGSSAGAGTSLKKRSSGTVVSDTNDAKVSKSSKIGVDLIGKESSFSGDKLTSPSSATTNKRSSLIKGIDGTAAGDTHDEHQQGSGSVGHNTTGPIIDEVVVKGTSAPASTAASPRTMSSQSGFITLGAVLVSAITAFAW